MADPLSSLNRPAPASILRPPRRTGAGSAAAFDASLPESRDIDAAATGTAAQVGAVNPMLLHELAVDGQAKRDREAHRHGTAVLDLLAELQLGLLDAGSGAAIDAGIATRLVNLVADPPVAANPELAAALRAVLLRARIEIARHRPSLPVQD